MKKLSFFMMIPLAILMLQSCNRAKDSKAKADSSNVAKDTSKSSAMTGSMAVDENDSRFATTAAAAGMAEVDLGKIAEQKAVNHRVKSFANMMVTDHTKANDALASLAKTKNITLPSAPDADAQKKADELSKKSGKGFDKDYVDAMIDGHKKAVKLFTDASQNCKDPDLKAFATNTLPTIKMHLDSIQAIHDSMK